MKNLLSKVHPIVPSLSLMGLLFIVALLITSCGVHYVQCDAYGKVNNEKNIDLKSNYKFKITNDAKESFLANNK